MINHVYPLNDLKEHDTESSMCACKPRVEIVVGGMIIVHNSYDHREVIECVQDILNKKEEGKQ